MRKLRLSVLVLGGLLLAGVAATASGGGAQIVDPAGDLHVAVGMVGLPEPSIDVLSVTFGRSADNLTVKVALVDLDYRLPNVGPVQGKGYSVHFSTESHAHVFVIASYNRGFGWRADLFCHDAGLLLTCAEGLAPPVLDLAQDEIHMAAPLSVLSGRVLGPSINTHVEYRNVPDAWPTLALQDVAPNCEVTRCPLGADYDPYQEE